MLNVLPPNENDALATAEIAAIKNWIAGGAPWPETKAPAVVAAPAASLAALDPWNAKSTGGVVVPTSGGLSDDWTNRTYQPSDIWAYLPLRRANVIGAIHWAMKAALIDRGRIAAHHAVDGRATRRWQIH